MPVTFVRNLAHAPGVQLNRLVDASKLPAPLLGDQAFGVAMRATRGRIDKALRVNSYTLRQKLGAGEPIRANALNEAWAQLYEALVISGGEAIVSRLVRESQAAIKWAVSAQVAPVAPATAKTYAFGTVDILSTETAGSILTESGDRILLESTLTNGVVLVKHLGCHNDGIKLSLWVEPVMFGGVEVATKVVNLRLLDASGDILFSFKGSTDPLAKNEYGQSFYLPDVVKSQTDELIVEVAENALFSPGEALYGYSTLGGENWQTSALLTAFTEGDYAYTADDYQSATDRLKYSQDDFSYLASGGTQSAALLTRLARLAFDTNRQLRFDVDGRLTPEAAIAFVETLNLSALEEAHLLHAFWAPIKSDDMSGTNPNGYLGASMLNVAMACVRNVTVNTRGMAAKNYPVAGRSHPIQRMGLRQSVVLRDLDLSNLARARINPVVFDTFSDGSFCVFRDQVTMADVDNSLKTLISVVDMSTAIDDRATRYGKSLINSYPMRMAVKRMQDFLSDLFGVAQASGWLVPSTIYEWKGAAYQFMVAPNAARPYDAMDVSYSLHYDGAVRQIVVTQTLSR